MSEPGKRAALSVLRAGPIGAGLNVMPLNDFLVFMYEHQIAPEVIREFTERTAGAVTELDEAAAREAAKKKEADEAWDRKRQERIAGKKKPVTP